MQNLYEIQLKTAGILADRTLGLAPASDSLVHLAGSVGSGRTTVLSLTHIELTRRGVQPIFLPVEQSEFDSGANLLARLYDGISHNQSGSLSPDAIRSPRVAWHEKFTLLKHHFDSHADKYVFLCDEPLNWPKLDRSWNDVETVKARRIADWIFGGTNCRRIVSGRIPETVTRRVIVRTRQLPDAHDFLRDSGQWSAAADLAKSVASNLSDHGEYRSVMEVRMAIAFAWLFSPEIAADELRGGAIVPGLVKSFLDKLESAASETSRYQMFCQALLRMTFGRTRWSDEILESTCPKLSTLDRAVLKNSLCEEWEDGRFLLHPFVRYEVLERSQDRTRPSRASLWQIDASDESGVHRALLDDISSQSVSDSLAGDLEYLNHWALCEGNQLSTDNERIHFVDQLHEIGAALSYRYSKYEKAIEVYRLALGFDAEDARSHHYLAFNLDWIAEKPEEVEKHYQKAIENNSQHPWYHSRWISYLVTRGQNQKALAAWREANEDLSLSEDSPDWMFLSLHRWIARWMLHWGELGMAEDVLNSIKSDLRHESSIARLFGLLKSLRLAEEGIAVFPLSVDPAHWWDQGGHTGLDLELGSERLDWRPARIDSVGDDVVELSVGYRNSESQIGFVVREKQFSTQEIAACGTNFEIKDIAEGRFIELGYYGASGLKRIGMHRSLEITDPDIPRLNPPPNRWYLRSRKWAWENLKGRPQ